MLIPISYQLANQRLQIQNSVILGFLVNLFAVAAFILFAYLQAADWAMDLSGWALLWAGGIVEPVLEPYYHGRTGMLDGSYRLILWSSSLVIEQICYTAFFYLMFEWARKK